MIKLVVMVILSVFCLNTAEAENYSIVKKEKGTFEGVQTYYISCNSGGIRIITVNESIGYYADSNANRHSNFSSAAQASCRVKDSTKEPKKTFEKGFLISPVAVCSKLEKSAKMSILIATGLQNKEVPIQSIHKALGELIKSEGCVYLNRKLGVTIYEKNKKRGDAGVFHMALISLDLDKTNSRAWVVALGNMIKLDNGQVW